ncbi:hypothetical protein Rs2_21808 [Raphanus sativus]|nr:hypothetical protein Rs2_21808 [Raphanus sativus]
MSRDLNRQALQTLARSEDQVKKTRVQKALPSGQEPCVNVVLFILFFPVSERFNLLEDGISERERGKTGHQDTISDLQELMCRIISMVALTTMGGPPMDAMQHEPPLPQDMRHLP